jgi:hypothetical protein
MRKQCTRCGKVQPYSEFQKRASASSGLHSQCKTCTRAYDNKYYGSNPRRKKYIKQKRTKEREAAHQYICAYLQSHPCVDCGEDDPVVLEFDHVRGNKRASVSKLKTCSKKAVVQEIKKCVVRCANCHRRKTSKQLGWKSKTAPIA